MPDFKKANWKKLNSKVSIDLGILEANNFPLNSQEEINQLIENISKILTSAANDCIPLKKPHKFRYPDSQEINNLKLIRNRLRKSSIKSPSLKNAVNNLNRQIKTLSAQLRTESFNHKLASLDKNDLSLFMFAKTLKKKFKPIPPLTNDNLTVFASKDKADLIASTFLKSHIISNSVSPHTAKIDISIKKIDQTNTDYHNHDRVTFDDVKEMIDSSKIKKAAGFDGITNRVVKNCPVDLIEIIAKIYSSCLKIGYFPTSWKKGKIIAIAKPCKNPELPGSYRPITLLPVLGKMFEKIILQRFRNFEFDNAIIIPQQFGFRSQHSTTQQVLRLTEMISLRFNENKSTAITLLDIEKTFDSVWHNALLHKLLVCPNRRLIIFRVCYSCWCTSRLSAVSTSLQLIC